MENFIPLLITSTNIFNKTSNIDKSVMGSLLTFTFWCVLVTNSSFIEQEEKDWTSLHSDFLRNPRSHRPEPTFAGG